METVPDIVQLPDDKTGIEKQQQSYCADFVPETDLFRQQIQHHQKHADNAAVYIGQTFLKIRFQSAAHIACHLPHGIQQTLQIVLLGNVQPETGGEFIHHRLGGLQRPQGRQFQNRRHADGKSRKHSNSHQIQEKRFPAAPTADLIHKEQQKNKDAGKQTNIIVGKDGEKQGNRIQDKLLFLQQLYRSQSHQRQQGKGIQPHHIPLESQCPGAQAVKPTEHRDGKVISSEELFQKYGEEQSRKAQLDGYQQRKILQQPAFRHQHAEQV